MMTNMANRIRRARALARVSQSQLAAQVGVTRSAVAQWESKANVRPSMDHLSSVAIVTGVQFEWLATGRGSIKPEGDQAHARTDFKEFAQSDTETRLLALLRRLSAKRQEMVCDIIEMMAK